MTTQVHDIMTFQECIAPISLLRDKTWPTFLLKIMLWFGFTTGH